MTITDEPIPSVDVVARTFIDWLEDRGATFRMSPETDLWNLNLDNVVDMTAAEAEEIVTAAFDIRDAIRAVLRGRRAPSLATIH